MLPWEVLEQRICWGSDTYSWSGQLMKPGLLDRKCFLDWSPPNMAKKNSAKIWGADHLVSGEFSVPFQEERHLLPGSVLSEG